MSNTSKIRLIQPAVKAGTSPSQGFSVLLSGATIILTGAILGRILEFITRIMLGHHLGPGDFGLFNSVLALLSILVALVSLGLPTGIVRFVGHYKGEKKSEIIPELIHNTFWLIAFGALVAGFVLWLGSEWLAIHLFNEVATTPLLRQVAVALPLLTVLSLVSALFQAEKMTKSFVLVNNFTLPLIRLCGVLLAIILGWTLYQTSSTYIVGALIIPLIAGFLLIRQTPFNLFLIISPKTKNLVPLIRFSLPLLVGALFSLAIWQVDLLILQREWGAEETGLYAAALTIGRLPVMILLAFTFVLAPVSAELYSVGRIDRMRHLYQRSVEVLFLLTLPIVAIIVLFATQLLQLLFGPAYVSAAPALRILATGFFLQTISGPNGNTLIMMGHSRRYLCYTVLAGLVTIGLYLLLITPLGKTGAAVATVAGILLLNGSFAWNLYRKVDINPLRGVRLALVAPLTLALSAALLIQRLFGHSVPTWLLLPVLISITLTSFIGLAIIFRLVHPQEIRALQKLLKPK